MCGIVAAAAGSNIVRVLVEGLKTLEYRGYDSAGLAVIGAGAIECVRSVGRVAELEAIASVPPLVEVASEYRNRSSVVNSRQLIVAISRSGHAANFHELKQPQPDCRRYPHIVSHVC